MTDEADIWEILSDEGRELFDDFGPANKAYMTLRDAGKHPRLVALKVPRSLLIDGRYLYDHTRYSSAAEALRDIKRK